jgi:hypothetical protein
MHNATMNNVRRGRMGERPVWQRRRSREPGESIISAISVGTVFILIGLVFVLALPNSLWDRTWAFFGNLRLESVPGIGIVLPAPASPSIHTVFYTAVAQFTLGIAFLQILVIALRIAWRSRISRIAEAFGNLVFWFGASYLVSTFLNGSTTLRLWFAFWAGILIVVGLSIIVRAAVLMIKK